MRTIIPTKRFTFSWHGLVDLTYSGDICEIILQILRDCFRPQGAELRLGWKHIFSISIENKINIEMFDQLKVKPAAMYVWKIFVMEFM